MYSTRLSSCVSFSFKVASLERHDVSVKRIKNFIGEKKKQKRGINMFHHLLFSQLIYINLVYVERSFKSCDSNFEVKCSNFKSQQMKHLPWGSVSTPYTGIIWTFKQCFGEILNSVQNKYFHWKFSSDTVTEKRKKDYQLSDKCVHRLLYINLRENN